MRTGTIKRVLLACVFAMLIGASYGRDARGVLVVMPYAGADRPKAISFADINWKTAASLNVTDVSGTSSSVSNDLVVDILYLDSDYLRGINLDDNQSPYRTEVRSKEIDVGTLNQNLTLDVELDRLNASLKRISDIITQYPTLNDALDPVRTDLNTEIARYQKGDRKDKGKWYSADDYKVHLAEVNKHKGLSLTTKSGKKYDDVVLGDATKEGITITDASGAATIRLDDIPDLDHLPGWSDANLDKIDALRHQAEDLAAAAKPVAAPVPTPLAAPVVTSSPDTEKDIPTIKLTIPPTSTSSSPASKSP